jgi:hypothetical protein
MRFFSNGISTTVVQETARGTTEDNQSFTYCAPRHAMKGTITPASGTVSLYGFTAGMSRTISRLGLSVGGSAAAGVTHCILGIYSVNQSNGGLTLVASTPDTTTVLTGVYTPYQIGLTTGYALVAGQRYMVAALVSASTMPMLNASQGSDDYGNNNYVQDTQQRLVGFITGQTSLPATIADNTIQGNGSSPHVLMAV